MKKIKNYLPAIAIAGLAAFTGCTKSNSTSPGYYMKATINGVPYNGSNCIVVLLTVPGASDSAWGIEGGNFGNSLAALTTYPQVDLTLNSQLYTGTGTYTFGPTTAGIVCSVDSSASSSAGSMALYGTVIITATSPNLVGTFSFTCIDSTKVTNGSFVAKAP